MSGEPRVQDADPALAERSPGLVAELRRYVAQHRAEFAAGVLGGDLSAGMESGRQYARACDGLLSSLLHAAQAAATRPRSWHSVSLAAVGSFGRGALSLYSDLDVRLLCTTDLNEASPIAEALLYPLWDAGLTVGHQVVSADQMLELARVDLPTATTLLDWRTIAGDRAPAAGMLDRAFEGLFGIAKISGFLDRMEQRAVEREERFGGSIYLLEPDVRNGPGGLRDWDVALWAARARWKVGSLRDLVRIGVLVPREWEQIEAAATLIWKVRNLLHAHAGRRLDRLSFERQEQIAEEMGYGTTRTAVERLMSDYYRHARTLVQARDMIFARAQPPPTRRPHEVSIGRGLKLVNGQITMAYPGSLENEPALAFRLYAQAVERGVRVYPFARSLVARAATLPSFGEKIRQSEEAARLFVRLCTHVPRSLFKGGSLLGELHDVGLLVAMVPEFAPLVGRVHHDVYHVYTVDIHSIKAVDYLRALIRGELAQDHPLASRLAAELARPYVLLLGALLHDVGKDIGGTRHSERGAELAAHVTDRLRLDPEDSAEICHLVRTHLRMYQMATRRDIDDEATLTEFARDVHGQEGLRALYLLTVADVSTTSPSAMTSWKAKMLEELYVGAERWLDQGTRPQDDVMAAAVQKVLNLASDDDERDFFRQFLDAMPERYAYGNSPAEVAHHARLARASLGKRAFVACVSADGPYLELLFVSRDRPGLLAMITATLAAARLGVVGAQVYSWVAGDGVTRAFDLFWVAAGSRARVIDRLVPELERNLLRLEDGELTPEQLAATRRNGGDGLSRHVPEVRTQISIDNRATARSTVLEVTTQDSPGLLFRLANTLQELGLRISLAKINTEGTLVADVFYVTDEHDSKLTDPDRVEQLKQRIVLALADR